MLIPGLKARGYFGEISSTCQIKARAIAFSNPNDCKIQGSCPVPSGFPAKANATEGRGLKMPLKISRASALLLLIIGGANGMIN